MIQVDFDISEERQEVIFSALESAVKTRRIEIANELKSVYQSDAEIIFAGFTYAKMVDSIREDILQLKAEIRRLKEIEWMYNDLNR